MSEQNEQPIGPLSPDAESRPGLLRVLGPGIAIAIVVGNVIGSGIYVNPGKIAGIAGDFNLIMAAWVTGGVLCILGSLCFAELAVMLPNAGGMYVYLREAYGRVIAFLFGWTDFIFGRPASIGALTVFFIFSLEGATGWKLGQWEAILLSFVVIAAVAWINVMGVIWGGGAQGLVTAIKAGFLALVAALPFITPLFGGEGIDADNYHSTLSAATDESSPPNDSDSAEPHSADESDSQVEIFAMVLLAVMWAYNGWHGITPIAEEVRNPQRNIPLALFGGIGILIVLYVLANVAYHGVLSMDEMVAEKNPTGVGALMVGRLIGPIGKTLMYVSFMLSALGAINANLLLGPRVSFAMGRDDIFFRSLGRVHVNFRTPAAAIILQAIMAIVLIVASALLIKYHPDFAPDESGKPKTNIFDLLTTYAIFSGSIFYMLAVLAVIVLRIKHPEWKRPYRTLGYPVTPIAYLTFYCFFLYYIYDGKPTEANIGLVLIAIGLPAYYGYRWWAKRNPETLHDGQ